MDTTTSIKMTTLAIQNLFSYVEEENLAALRAHLDRFKEVDGRSDVGVAQQETGSVFLSHVCLSHGLWWSVLLQNGQTPLMLAAEQGSLDIVQELIRRGANVNLDDVVRHKTLRGQRPRQSELGIGRGRLISLPYTQDVLSLSPRRTNILGASCWSADQLLKQQ